MTSIFTNRGLSSYALACGSLTDALKNIRSAAMFCGVVLLSLLWSSCSEKKLISNNDLSSTSGNYSIDTTSQSLAFHGSELEEPPLEDTLGFKENLDFTIYNRYINKDLLSRHVSTSASRIPEAVVNDITRKFYQTLQNSGKKRYFIENDLTIHDVQFYETTNGWYIYFIFLGSEFETTGYLAGCFDQQHRNYILKELFHDKCATYTFSAPKLKADGLEFSVHENYSCKEGHEKLFANIIVTSPDTLQHSRIPLPTAKRL